MNATSTESKEFEVTVTRERFEYHATVTVPADGDPLLEITRKIPESRAFDDQNIHEVFRMPKSLEHLQAIAELVDKAEEKLDELDRD